MHFSFRIFTNRIFLFVFDQITWFQRLTRTRVKTFIKRIVSNTSWQVIVDVDTFVIVMKKCLIMSRLEAHVMLVEHRGTRIYSCIDEVW